jgi:hypothetical protein
MKGTNRTSENSKLCGAAAPMPEEMWPDFAHSSLTVKTSPHHSFGLGSVATHFPTCSLYCDPHFGFLLQVHGRKRLDLYSTDQEELIYPNKAYNKYQPRWFRPEDPDYAVYPRAEEAKCLSVTLNPGEIIVQPAGWSHQVYASDSPNVLASYFGAIEKK